MAPTIEDEHQTQAADDKTLHVWSTDGAQSTATNLNARPTISEAVGMIKSEDFTNVHKKPCTRQGFMTGIAAGAGIGGLNFILRGNAVKASHWAVGIFILGSTISHEYCQFLRRAEHIQLKRSIEIVAQGKKEMARKAEEEKKEQLRLEREKAASQRPWYKFW
ncbi:hypothetical protein E4U55_003532 [Claviceps digitariae]|nr:hypothetical protein E4U55_003532 [Claviceps digitariae]